MTLDQFWNIIETAWEGHPKLLAKRDKAIAADDTPAMVKLADDIEDTILDDYQDQLYELERDELISFIHNLEERLYNIDRSEIQKATDCSDDGFIYARCFIVAMGKKYYDIVDNDPSKAAMDAEAEGFGFTAYSVYDDRFDEQFKRNSKHSIESGSNKAGW
jgi:hypothetical protein